MFRFRVYSRAFEALGLGSLESEVGIAFFEPGEVGGQAGRLRGLGVFEGGFGF